MDNDEKKVIPTTRDRECAERIFNYVMSPPGPSPTTEIEHIATILAAEREKDREVLEMLLAACKEFVRKVETGEAHSIKSYAQMKQAITKWEELLK